MKTANGNATASAAFQYLQSVQVNANPGLYKFLLYDRARQYVYLSATDHVDVFDLKAGSFKPGGLPIYCPSRMLAGPCPDADVRGLALTPDGTQLLVADFGSQNIFLLNPDSPGMVSYVPVNVTGFGPARVAATSAQTAFVSLVPVASSPGPCTGCLSELNLTASTIAPAPQPEVTTMTGTPLLQADAAGDRVFLAFAATSGGSEALWSAASPNAFSNFSVNENVIDIATCADGSLFATNVSGAIEIRDAALNLIGNRATPELEQFPTGVTIPGIAMHPGGGLVYQPFLNGPAPMESASPTPNPNLRGGIDIFDTHSGRLRLRILLPEPIAARSVDTSSLLAQFLSVDETGQRLFASHQFRPNGGSTGKHAARHRHNLPRKRPCRGRHHHHHPRQQFPNQDHRHHRREKRRRHTSRRKHANPYNSRHDGRSPASSPSQPRRRTTTLDAALTAN